MYICNDMQGVSLLLKRFIVGLACVSLLPSVCSSYELLIGTGAQDSFSYFAGRIICRSIHKFDNETSCRPVPSESYTDNLTNLQGGSLDLALVNSKMIYDAFHAEGLFEYVSLDYDQLRLLMPLYRTPISLVVRRDSRIRSWPELAGKRMNAGRARGLEEIVFRSLMTVEGWQESSFSLYQNLSDVNAQDYIALHNGSVQAMLHIGMHPDQRLANSLANGSTDIVSVTSRSVEQLVESKSGFSMQTIPMGTYPEQVDKIDTLSIENMLIASADTGSATVALVLEAIVTARKQLQNTHPLFLRDPVDVETLNASYLHPHPEAILYFQANQNRF